MDIREKLNAKMKEMGVRDLKPYMNDEWATKVKAIPEGPERKAEMDKFFKVIYDSLVALENGDMELCQPVGDSKLGEADEIFDQNQ